MRSMKSRELSARFFQNSTDNCELWHEQEKVYEFEKVPIRGKRSSCQADLLNEL